jgi:hypothetical protein
MYKDRPNAQDSTLDVEFKGSMEMIVREENGTAATFRRDPKSNQ